MRSVILSLLLLSCFSTSVFAHEDHSADLFNLESTLEVFQKVVQFSPELTSPQGPAVPVIKVGRERIYLNSAFWTLVRGWIDIYHREIERDCKGCVDFDEEELLREARDLASRGFFNSKVIHPLSKASEHIAVETADIGARFGNVALVAKISSEVAETVLSKTVGGGGVHILCSIIDAVILFGTRHLQIATRVPTWSFRLGAGNVGLPIKYWVTSKAIHRAQKRVSFFTGPIEFDDDMLDLVDEEGPKTRRWWGPIKGKRERWLRKIETKLNPLYQELQQIDEDLKKDPSNSKLARSKRRLEHKISSLTSLKRKEFLGTRYKRFFYLKGRRGPRQMMGSSPIESALGKNWLWIVNVQQNVLNRALISPQDEARVANHVLANHRLAHQSSDEVLRGLAEEAVAGFPVEEREEKRQVVQGLLSDVDFIFDQSKPRTHRYLQTLVIESTLSQLAYKFVNWQAETAEVGEGGWWSRLARSSRFRWSTGQFVKYVYEYTDFLRLASTTSSDKFRARYKYEAMETLLRIFKHLEELNRIFNEYSFISEMVDPVRRSNEQLMTFKPWREKRTKFSWIPGRSPYPRCEDLWEAHP